MDSFAWASSVSQTSGLAAGRAVSDALLPPMLGFQLPPQAGLEHFQVDTGLVERAARSSSFGAGNGTATAGMRLGHQSKVSAAAAGNENAEAETGLGGGVHHDAEPRAEAAAGDCSSGGPEPESKKRRYEDVLGTDEAKASNAYTDSANGSGPSKGVGAMMGGKENGRAGAAAAAAGKKKGKGAKDKEADEPYIHVRARSGQATNNHSLAERLRRERISERMKLLQDLVPGCSKVTGKAVMLDEIINYVQSLQRQVEFLSMKLATVNPRLGLNIEGLLSKDLIRFSGAPSSAPSGFSFSQEMMPKLPLLSQSGMLHGGVNAVANSNLFRTVMEDQPDGQDYFRDHSPQMPRASDGSLHDPGANGVQGSCRSGTPEHQA